MYLANDLMRPHQNSCKAESTPKLSGTYNMRRMLVFLKDEDLSEWVTESTCMLYIKIITSFLVLLYNLSQ